MNTGPTMTKNLINIVLFQLGWFICVWGVNAYALTYTLVALLIHHFFIMRNHREWLLIGIVTLTGVCWDTWVAHNGWMIYHSLDVFGLPIWLMCLWLLFGTTLQHSLIWLQSKPLWAATLGLIFGTLSYWAGSQWSAAQIGSPVNTALLMIGLGWLVLLPCYFKIAQRLNI